MRRAGIAAYGLWNAMVRYASFHQTDGRVPFDALPDVWPWETPEALLPLCDRLVEVGLLERSEERFGNAWAIHDYLEYQPSRSDLRRAKQLARARKDRWKQQVDGTRSERVRNALVGTGRDGTGSGSGRARAREVTADVGEPAQETLPPKVRPNSSVAAVWDALCAARAEAGLDALPLTEKWTRAISDGLRIAPSVAKLCAGLRAAVGHLDEPWKGGGSWAQNFTPKILMREDNVARLLAWADEGHRKAKNGHPSHQPFPEDDDDYNDPARIAARAARKAAT